MRARILTALGVVLFVMAPGGPASADLRPDTGGGAYIDPTGDPTATATDAETVPANTGSGGGTPPPCRWRVAVEDDFVFGVHVVDTAETQHSATGRWLQYWCEDTRVVPVNGNMMTPEGGLVDPRAVAVDALASVQISPPPIRTSPSEAGRLYVQVPTWLWLDGGWWRTYEATAQAGRVWSTVTVRPASVTWTMGDARTVVCNGPGTPWTPGSPEDGSDCTHTYRRSSAGNAGGVFSMDVTVTLEVTWTSNAPSGGSLPDITRSSVLEVEVGEIHAVGTRGASR